jgi:creatinine amidohydrolase
MSEANERVMRLEEIPWPRVAALDPDRTAVFLPSGPIEQHGPHLPLGADLFQARTVLDAIAERVAAEGWHVLVAPALPYTTAVLSRSYPGSTSVRKGHAVPFFADVVNSFAANGLRNVVVVSQHIDPPHVLAWEEACKRAAAETGARAIEGYERMVFDDLRTGALRDLLGGEWPPGDSHAGLFETSVMLAARPDLVDAEALGRLEPAPMDFEEDLRRARDFRDLGNGLGYTGDPAAGDPETGRLLVRRYARAYGDLVVEHLEGGDVWDRLSVGHLFPARPG